MESKYLLPLVGCLILALSACIPSAGGGGYCCKYCSAGKPCGNTCISSNKTCHISGGCACYGSGNQRIVLIADNGTVYP
jgi:hypothetical protein